MGRLAFEEYPTSCWRYEYLDGGGPWFYPNGEPRDIDNVPAFENDEGVMYGCDTVKNLDRYMAERSIDTRKMRLVRYFDIEVINYNPRNGHIAFLKRRY